LKLIITENRLKNKIEIYGRELNIINWIKIKEMCLEDGSDPPEDKIGIIDDNIVEAFVMEAEFRNMEKRRKILQEDRKNQFTLNINETPTIGKIFADFNLDILKEFDPLQNNDSPTIRKNKLENQINYERRKIELLDLFDKRVPTIEKHIFPDFKLDILKEFDSLQNNHSPVIE
jgi:hypothetical protein